MNATARKMAILATTLMSVAACTSTSTQSGFVVVRCGGGAGRELAGSRQVRHAAGVHRRFEPQRTGDIVQASAKTNFVSPMMTAKNEPYLSATTSIGSTARSARSRSSRSVPTPKRICRAR